MSSHKFLPLLLLPLLLVPVYAQETTEIPAWVKGVAGFWAEDKISDSEFAEGITFLIEQQIIVIDSTPITPTQSLSAESERLYKLELDQKDVKITNIENENEYLETENSELTKGIEDRDHTLNAKYDQYRDLKEEYDQYKKDYPLKVGNIGGKQVNADTVRQLETQLSDLRQIVGELEDENNKLEKENKELKSQ